MAAPDPVFLATAIEVVLRAGAMQMERFGTAMRIHKKSAIDLVTEVDVAVERMFRDLIRERFPDHDVLAEELGGMAEVDRPHARCRWVFDPIDGTTNFAHGVPIFCASLALEVDGEAAVGAIFDPSRHELFTAERGGGAFLNGSPIGVSEASSLIDGLVVTGFPYNVHQRTDEMVSLFGRFLGRARAVRRLGSAALDLCYVASGRMDAFWEEDLKPWDMAAGALLVAEAGGRVTGMDGSAFRSRQLHVLASNGRIHDEMLAVIGEERREREARRIDPDRSPKRTN